MSEKTAKRLTASGPITLRELNPKAIARFDSRVCETCESPILGHWIIPNDDPELATSYWCDRLGTQASEGLKV